MRLDGLVNIGRRLIGKAAVDGRAEERAEWLRVEYEREVERLRRESEDKDMLGQFNADLADALPQDSPNWRPLMEAAREAFAEAREDERRLREIADIADIMQPGSSSGATGHDHMGGVNPNRTSGPGNGRG